MGPDPGDTRRTRLLIGYLATMAALSVVTVALDLTTAAREQTLPEPLITPGWIAVLTGLPPIVLGTLLVRSRPRHAVGWALSAFGLLWQVNSFTGEWASYGALVAPDAFGVGLADWFYSRVGAWVVPLLALVGVVFPDGRLPGDRRWRLATITGFGIGIIAPVALLAAPLSVLLPLASARDPRFEAIGVDLVVLPLPDDVWRLIVVTGKLTLLGILTVPLAATVHRYRHADGEQRAQIRWLMWAIVVSLIVVAVMFNVPSPWDELAFTVIVALICAAIAVAVTRHRLYDIDRLLPGTVVYAGLAATFLVADAVVIAVAGRLLGQRDAALVAMALVAVGYAVARDWLWRLARRLLLGVRPDSQQAVAALARQLELAATPEEQLRGLAHTVARELRLPYVLVEVERGNGERVTVTHGTPSAHLIDLPVAYRGARIGRLVLGTRWRGGLRTGDQTLLGDLVRQAAAAARASDEAASLRRARVALVTAREEERRRLRRDLHDGLGPAIAAASMQLKAARGLVGVRPADVDRLLAGALAALDGLMDDVRHLVYGMRPPALDDLGLVAALAPQLDAVRNAGVEVRVDADEPLPGLPAACEVAAYRIVVEALTNVVRHAGARHCAVTIRPADHSALEIVVRDDGRGMPCTTAAGVGIVSMRERAAELGGSCAVVAAPGGGTEVRCVLPYLALPAKEPADA